MSRNNGASVGSVVKAQMVMESVATVVLHDDDRARLACVILATAASHSSSSWETLSMKA